MAYHHHLHQQPRERLESLPSLRDLITQRKREGKQIVEIILLKEELMHDIEAGLHSLEKNRPADAPALLDADGKDDYLLLRHIDTAVNQVVSRCQAYLLLPSPFVHRVSTDHVHGWEEKSICLALPHNWPPHCVDPLRDAAHNYIVERAQQLFMMKVDQKLAESIDFTASLYWNDINAELNTRLGGVHIHPTFLG